MRKFPKWKTKAGVVVLELERAVFFHVAKDKWRIKIRAQRAVTGGMHGWIWLHNLTPVTE